MPQNPVPAPEAALFDAICCGHTPVVAAIITAHPLLLAVLNTHYGHTPLHHAAYWGKPDIAKLLLEHGADGHARGKLGRTPLHTRCVPGTPDVVAHLLAYGADVHARDDWNRTPLSYASSAAIVELLCDHGANVNDPSVPLIGSSFDAGAVARTRALLRRGANPNRSHHLSWKPLMWALWNGQIELVDLLLPFGAKITRGRGPAFHIAVSGGHIRLVEHLLQNGEDVNRRDKRGHTALHDVAGSGGPDDRDTHEPLAACLLSHGADPTLRDHEGRTCVHEAVMANSRWLWEYLLAHGGQRDAFIDAAIGPAGRVARLLHDTPDAVRMRDQRGYTLLHWAAIGDNLETMQLLAEHGANLNAADAAGDTALHDAILFKRTWAIHFLLDRGADANVAGEKGRTPLMNAADDPDTIRRLIAARADVNARDNDGCTALHGAAWMNDIAAAQLLAVHGATINPLSARGRTPLDVARGQKHVEMVDLLRRHGGRRGLALRR